jgi:hypothetical protein
MLYYGDAKVSEIKTKEGFPLVLESQLWRSNDVPKPLLLHHYKPIFKVENVKAVSVHTAVIYKLNIYQLIELVKIHDQLI